MVVEFMTTNSKWNVVGVKSIQLDVFLADEKATIAKIVFSPIIEGGELPRAVFLRSARRYPEKESHIYRSTFSSDEMHPTTQ